MFNIFISHTLYLLSHSILFSYSIICHPTYAHVHIYFIHCSFPFTHAFHTHFILFTYASSHFYYFFPSQKHKTLRHIIIVMQHIQFPCIYTTLPFLCFNEHSTHAINTHIIHSHIFHKQLNLNLIIKRNIITELKSFYGK